MKAGYLGSWRSVDWVELLDVIVVLHRAGMSVPMALEQHAHFGATPSRRLAEQWLAQRQISGDPVAAMRALAPGARHESDRFAQETLTICLEYPGSDHAKVLAAAAEHLAQEGGRRTVGRLPVLVGLALIGPMLIEVFRFLITGFEG